CRHRLGGHHLKLAGPALAVEQKRFLVGEGGSATIAFRRHLNPLQNPARTTRAPVIAVSGEGETGPISPLSCRHVHLPASSSWSRARRSRPQRQVVGDVFD